MKKFKIIIFLSIFLFPFFSYASDIMVGGNINFGNLYSERTNVARKGEKIVLGVATTFDKIAYPIGVASSTRQVIPCSYYIKLYNSACTQIATSSNVSVNYYPIQPHAELIFFPMATSTTLQSGTYYAMIDSSNCSADSTQMFVYESSLGDGGGNPNYGLGCLVNSSCQCVSTYNMPVSLWYSQPSLTSNVNVSVSGGGSSGGGSATTTTSATSTDIGQIISYTDGTYTHYQIPFLLFQFVAVLIVFSVLTGVLLIILKKRK